MAGRMPLDRLIARDDSTDFKLAAVDAISGAATKPLCCCRSNSGAGDFANTFRAAVASRKPYLIEATI
jgi:hypothetical protein